MVVGTVLVMLLLVVWRAAELTWLPPDIAHKTTAEWVVKVSRERGGDSVGGVFGAEQHWLEERMRRLV